MTPLNALDCAHLDALSALHRHRKAGGSLAAGSAMTLRQLDHRMRTVHVPSAWHAATLKRAHFPPPNAADPATESLAWAVLGWVEVPAEVRPVDPDDLLALAIWAVGTASEPRGFFRLFWSQTSHGADQGGALDRLDRAMGVAVAQLAEEDQALRLREAGLGTLRSYVAGLRRDAEQFWRDGDAEAGMALRRQWRGWLRGRIRADLTSRGAPGAPGASPGTTTSR